jgi:hypothetical protein
MTTLMAQGPLERRVSRLRFEARRICDRDEVSDLETLDKVHASLVHREFLREIKPFIDAKARVFQTVMPHIRLHSDGTIECKYILTEAQQSTMDSLDALIAHVGEQYGVTANEKVS